jgi:hypothetical protein
MQLLENCARNCTVYGCLSNKCVRSAPQFLCQKSLRLYDCYSNKCCTKLLKNRALFSLFVVPIFVQLMHLKNRATTFGMHVVLLLYGLLLFVVIQTVKIRIIRPPQSCCTLLDICAQKPTVQIPKIRTVRACQVLYLPQFMCKFVALESMPSTSANVSLSSSSTSSSLALSKMFHLLKNGCALLPKSTS